MTASSETSSAPGMGLSGGVRGDRNLNRARRQDNVRAALTVVPCARPSSIPRDTRRLADEASASARTPITTSFVPNFPQPQPQPCWPLSTQGPHPTLLDGESPGWCCGTSLRYRCWAVGDRRSTTGTVSLGNLPRSAAGAPETTCHVVAIDLGCPRLVARGLNSPRARSPCPTMRRHADSA